MTQKDKVGRPDVASYETAMNRAKSTAGFHVACVYNTDDAMKEIGRCFKETSTMIGALTVRVIPDAPNARKLAQ